MKISFKTLTLLFAVGMMSIVACSDDDGDDPTPVTPVIPPGGNGGNGGGGGGQAKDSTGVFAIVNQDSTDFSIYSAILDTFSLPSKVRIKASNLSKSASIDVTFNKGYTGTDDLSGPQDVIISFKNNGTQFSPNSGSFVVNQNDSIVAGSFYFEGTPVAGTDTLTVTDGKFHIKL